MGVFSAAPLSTLPGAWLAFLALFSFLCNTMPRCLRPLFLKLLPRSPKQSPNVSCLCVVAVPTVSCALMQRGPHHAG